MRRNSNFHCAPECLLQLFRYGLTADTAAEPKIRLSLPIRDRIISTQSSADFALSRYVSSSRPKFIGLVRRKSDTHTQKNEVYQFICLVSPENYFFGVFLGIIAVFSSYGEYVVRCFLLQGCVRLHCDDGLARRQQLT